MMVYCHVILLVLCIGAAAVDPEGSVPGCFPTASDFHSLNGDVFLCIVLQVVQY